MKTLLYTFLIAGFTSTAFASDAHINNDNCIDIPVTFVTCNNDNETPIFVDGKCEGPRYAETFYCVDLEQPPVCTDLRVVFMQGCEEGELKFIQGRCEENYEFETFYCSSL